jgi:hypothetical protein
MNIKYFSPISLISTVLQNIQKQLRPRVCQALYNLALGNRLVHGGGDIEWCAYMMKATTKEGKLETCKMNLHDMQFIIFVNKALRRWNYGKPWPLCVNCRTF